MKLTLFWQEKMSWGFLVFLMSICASCAHKSPLLLPTTNQIYLIESFRNQETKKIVTRILQKDSAGKMKALSPEDYLKVNDYYVVDPTTMRQIMDRICSEEPEFCEELFKKDL